MLSRNAGDDGRRLLLREMLRFKRDERPVAGNVMTQSADYLSHPLVTTNAVTIELERDRETNSFVTYVSDLGGLSTFGDTELDALDMTAEMLRGYIESMQERGMPVPLAAAKLVELKRVVGL